jgi:hypothetical protein
VTIAAARAARRHFGHVTLASFERKRSKWPIDFAGIFPLDFGDFSPVQQCRLWRPSW